MQNRSIKFRAWDKEDIRMITHNQDFIPLMVTNWGVMKLSPHHDGSLWFLIAFDRFELMQFTGLTDKNGKEIYEGDICRTNHFINGDKQEYLYHVIKWSSVYGMFVAINKSNYGGNESLKENGNCMLFSYANMVPSCEIIGNVLENPELLNPTV